MSRSPAADPAADSGPGTDTGRISRVIALDGPAGSGKSTVARAVAKVLAWRYVDTGATYRAATLAVLQAGTDPADQAAVAATVSAARISLGTDPEAPSVWLDGRDVSRSIRGADVTAAVSAVSSVAAVRTGLVALQQELIGTGDVVVEGRDICAVVAPDARVKIFLDADPLIRASRRATDADTGVALVAGSAGVTAAVAADLARRDAVDSTRAASPLAAAPDAVHLDASFLDADQVVARVLELAAEAGLVARAS